MILNITVRVQLITYDIALIKLVIVWLHKLNRRSVRHNKRRGMAKNKLFMQIWSKEYTVIRLALLELSQQIKETFQSTYILNLQRKSITRLTCPNKIMIADWLDDKILSMLSNHLHTMTKHNISQIKIKCKMQSYNCLVILLFSKSRSPILTHTTFNRIQLWVPNKKAQSQTILMNT